MPRFYVNSSDIHNGLDGSFVVINGQDAIHIAKVLRMRLGDNLTVCDENSYEYSTIIIDIGECITLKIQDIQKSHNEPPYRTTVYQALVKGDRFDTVLQKATELGATEFVPFISSRCIQKIDPKDYQKKIDRWNKIVYEASKQCGRGTIPKVNAPIHFSDALDRALEDDLPLFCYEDIGTESIKTILDKIKSPNSVSVIIGPEGGFSEDEAQLASMKGLIMTGLGNRILRTETAAPFVLSCLSFKFEI